MPYITANGTRLYYERTGAGPALVMLHGWGSSGRVWNAQLADLARDHTVVTVDWRGCGRSDRPADGNTVAGVAADVHALCDALELDRPVLVGNSIGGSFAIAAASAAPGRFGGVVSVNGPGHWPGQGMAGELSALVGRLAEDRAGTVAGWVPGWYAPGAAPALVEWTVRQILDSGVFIDPLLTESAAWDPRPLVSALTVPAAFIHGVLDAAIPADVSRTLAGLAPHGTYHPLDACGHMPHQERPAAFNAALREALAAMPARVPATAA